ncbi:U6 snRNA-associated SM-like protein [Cryptosporidium ubiquitum]|uniref:U6 snRNA-associated Sm-like protein LSm8 n=1 Tax=Cryptosporidium ubiquitum TaxID=857276 RepID=A0A1J4MMB7_9CRYT|nr:U6 snRNA-associated SM-like protein [Cryptosporidium ubiquitum]OII75191.1 U6 snRNA-associated SM-like protein [Cryptosporidium ubiquitum]
MNSSTLEQFINKTVNVLTVDNKVYIGNLVGFDQLTNIVLQNCSEKIYNKDLNKVEIISMESLVLRGDCIGMVGEGSEDLIQNFENGQQRYKRQKISD